MASTPSGPYVPQGIRGLLEEAANALADAKTKLEGIDTDADGITDDTLKATIKGKAADGITGIGGSRIYNDYHVNEQ